MISSANNLSASFSSTALPVKSTQTKGGESKSFADLMQDDNDPPKNNCLQVKPAAPDAPSQSSSVPPVPKTVEVTSSDGFRSNSKTDLEDFRSELN